MSDEPPPSGAKADVNPLSGFHWKTAIAITGFFSFIAGIWITNDQKLHELKTARLEAAEKQITKLETVQTELASTTEKLKRSELDYSSTKISFDALLAQNWEQKYKAETVRSQALQAEIDSSKLSMSLHPTNSPVTEQKATDLEKKLAIATAERDQLRDLYTRTAVKPERPLSQNDSKALIAGVSDMTSTDARDSIIAVFKNGSGTIAAGELARIYKDLASSDKLEVIESINSRIERPVSSEDIRNLTRSMSSTDASSAIKALSGKSHQ